MLEMCIDIVVLYISANCNFVTAGDLQRKSGGGVSPSRAIIPYNHRLTKSPPFHPSRVACNICVVKRVDVCILQ